MAENSRWDLTESRGRPHNERSYDFIVDFLRRVEQSEPYRARSVGRRARCASRSGCVASALRRGGDEMVAAEARAALRDAGSTRCASLARCRRRSIALSPRRQQLIHLSRVGAALRLLHHARPARPAASSRPREARRLVRHARRSPRRPRRRAARRRPPEPALPLARSAPARSPVSTISAKICFAAAVAHRAVVAPVEQLGEVCRPHRKAVD